jgi:hypothetical protein
VRGETPQHCPVITLTPALPAWAQKNHLRPFDGRKVHRTFLCFRLTSIKGEGVILR